MSNHWIRWRCQACTKSVTVSWIVQPGWPSGIVHERSGFCQECFREVAEDYFVHDEAVDARLQELSSMLAERVLGAFDKLEGRPKERFLALGLDESGARGAAQALAEYRGALSARNRWKRDQAGTHLSKMAAHCMRTSCTLLRADESALLASLTGKTVTPQDTSRVPLLVGNPHVPGGLQQQGSARVLDGKHDVFYVTQEAVGVVVPPNAGERLRAAADGTPHNDGAPLEEVGGTVGEDKRGKEGAMDAYEKKARDEVELWMNPPRTWFDDALRTLNAPIEAAADWAMDTSVGEAVAKAVEGCVSLINDAASWSVREEAVYSEFRDNGHTKVTAAKDIAELSLEKVETTLGYLGAKYKTVAAAEGAGAGALGLPGIAIDVPVIIGLALRAVAEYGTYYGYSMDSEGERRVVIGILGAASAGKSLAAKQTAMAQLAKAVTMAGKRVAWRELERLGVVMGMKKLAEQLGIRLTKAKLAQAVPGVGAFVGAGFNAWYMDKVCETAFMVYRARFLGIDIGRLGGGSGGAQAAE